MKDGLTAQVLAEAGPTVIGTLLKHYLTPRRARADAYNHDTARVEFMYDEAFNVAKMFLNVSTQHTADALQKFGQTRTPSPPWVALHRVSIPQVTLSLAADYLIEALGGEEMAYKIAGGTTWWQVRAGPGLECEWITMKKDVRYSEQEEALWAKENDIPSSKDGTPSHSNTNSRRKPSGHSKPNSPAPATPIDGPEDERDSGFIPEMDKMRFHGGGYYWGSINTHRYLIWRFARKINGRAFAVNYRIAPQYPFPCAIQDVLAAYLYLVNPPPGAPHRPVDPKNIILAGDSAGGGLVWALLQILRDTPGLELPAGAVLISPWSDLTHSFPSILKNTKTDVLPPYSFIHKPSSLWPPPPPELSDSMKTRIMSRVRRGLGKASKDHDDEAYPPLVPEPRSSTEEVVHTSDPEAFMKLKDIFNPGKDAEREPVASASHATQAAANPAAIFENLTELDPMSKDQAPSASLASCDDSLSINARGMTVICDTQIQLYARNSQLCHPYVSPVLGYLGGLPPLYILAGNSEVLRDEIIYSAHKAAHPEQHPIRDDVKKLLPSLVDIEGKYGPTDVHLQVYDGVGHDLPLFSMTKPARGAIRAIATFCREVTPNRNETQDSSGTPANATPPNDATPRVLNDPLVDSPKLAPINPADSSGPHGSHTARLNKRLQELKLDGPALSDSDTENDPTSPDSTTASLAPSSVSRSSSISTTSPHHSKHKRQSTLSSFFKRPSTPPPRPSTDTIKIKSGPGEAGWPGIYAGDPYTDHMIRERVNFDGQTRPLEPESELDAMTMPATEIGMVKEGPALRYIEGQAIWDKKFRHTRKRIARHRRRNLAKARTGDEKTLRDRWSKVIKGAKGSKDAKENKAQETTDSETSDSDDDPLNWCERNSEHIPTDSSWAWQWALGGEHPPPSAIVGRRDLPEGRKAALQADRVDTTDDSEMHALSIWVMLAQLFSSGSENMKASKAWKEAKAEFGHKGEKKSSPLK